MDSSKNKPEHDSRTMRHHGTSSSPGRFSRVYKSEIKAASKDGAWSHHLSPVETAKRHKLYMILSAVVALFILAVIVGFMVLWMRSYANQKPPKTHSSHEKEVAIESNIISLGKAKAVALAHQALAVRDAADVQSCMHSGGATVEEILKFMKNLEMRDGMVTDVTWSGSININGSWVDGVKFLFIKDGQTSVRLGVLIPDKKGDWKMDFDAFARSTRPSWGEILDGKAPSAEVRVSVTRDTYYNGPFQSEDDWVCYAMYSPDTKTLLPEDQYYLRGYCKRNSPQAKAMQVIMATENQIKTGGFGKKGTVVNRAILKIQHQEGAHFRQFEITQVLGHDWVMPAKPFDSKYRE